MKFQAQKSALLDALGRCIAVADPKAIDRTLASVLLDTRGRLSATTTDLYRAMTADIHSEQDTKGGCICLPARELHERIRLMPDGPISVHAPDLKAVISAPGSRRRFTMAGFPGTEFPSVPRPPATGGERFQTTTHSLAELLASVQHAMSLDSGRLNINGIMLEVDASGQRAVATDGHRMSTVLRGDEPAGMRWLIPQSSVADFKRLCDTKADEDVTLTQDRGTLFAQFTGYTFSTKLIDSSFVPWRSIIPPQFKRVVRVDREALASGIRAVSVSSGTNGAVHLTFRPGALALQAGASLGDGFDEIETDYNGPEFTIGASFRLLLDALNVIATDAITIATSDELDPIAIRIPGHDDAFLAIVMPIRI